MEYLENKLKVKGQLNIIYLLLHMQNRNLNKNHIYGYVYCITNKFIPELCKIGFVDTFNKTSHNRARELSQTTSCPFPFEVIFDIRVKNPAKYEKRIHKKLHKLRVNKNREFFKIRPEDLIKFFYKEKLIYYKEKEKEEEDFDENYLTIYNISKFDKINKTETKTESESESKLNLISIFIKLSLIYYVVVYLS